MSNLNPSKIESIVDRDSLNSFQSNSKVLSSYLTAFDSYRLFQKRFGRRDFSNELGYHHVLNLSGIRIALVGLNTAWSSGYTQIHGRGISEQGYLTIGEQQLRGLLPNSDDSDFTIALMHHPISWLADFDRATIEPIITDSCDIVLHGHVHRPTEIAEIRGLRGSYLSLGSGASYERRVALEPFVNSYSVIELDPDKRTVTVILRKYSDSPIPTWTSHEDPFGEGSGGIKTFPVAGAAAHTERRTGDAAHAVSYGSVTDIYRSLPSEAQHLLKIHSAIKSGARTNTLMLSGVYEAAILSWANTVDLKPTGEIAVAILLAATILMLAEQKPEVNVDALVLLALTKCSGHADRTEIDNALKKGATCWQALLQDFEVPPYALIQEAAFGPCNPLAVAPAFLAVALLLLSDAEMAATVINKSIPNRSDSGELVELRVPSNARIKGSVVSISVVSPTLAEFSLVSIIRQYLDVKIDQLVDVFSSINEQFSLSSLVLHFIERPKEWSEHRFSVDPMRVMRLLMGDALYGKQSSDVWFRELLQNGVDATAARIKAANDGEYVPAITFRYDAFDRRVTIADNGIGMTSDHVVRFFCKAGRSIWRSEELKAYNDSKNSEISRASIGKFGVGVLSIFQVADKVRVRTRFFRETAGSALEISNIEQPFFLQSLSGMPIGTEISIFLKEGYDVDTENLIQTYLTYLPPGVRITGLGPVPEDAEVAMSAMIDQTMRSWDGVSKSIHWEIKSVELKKLEATLKIAVPLTWSSTDSQDRAKIVDRTRARVSNGGVTVLEQSGLWLGEATPGRTEPKIEVTGLHALLDFSAGAAPVTVSRNAISLTESDAHGILSEARQAVVAAWEAYANHLFQNTDAELATRRLLKMLCASATAPPYWNSSWSSEPSFIKAAKDLLTTHGVLKVDEGGAGPKSSLMSIRDLVDSGRAVAILSETQRGNRLVQLYASKISDFLAVYGSTQREIALIGSCSARWSRLESDEDLWAAMQIEENRSLHINRFAPGDVAIVDGEYFIDADEPLIILATRRERADTVEGLSRADVRGIRPRVLLNAGHPLICSIERTVSRNEKAGNDLRNALNFLIAGVVEEKTKGRRSRRLKEVLAMLADIEGS